MSPASVSQTAKIAPAGSQASLVALLAAAAAGAGAALLPAGRLPLLGALVVSAAMLVATIARPMLLLHLVVVAAASGAVLRQVEGFSVGGNEVTLSGLRWLAVGASAVLIMIIRRPAVRVRFALIPYAALVLWMAARCALSEAPLRGLEDVVIYAVPLLLVLFADAVTQPADGRCLRRLERTLLASVVLPYGLYAVALAAGLEHMTADGPKGFVGSRPVALMMLIVLAMAIGVGRYERAAARRWAALASGIAAVGLILFTASRAASLVAMLLVASAGVDPTRLVAAGRRLLFGLVLAVLVLVSVPSLRARMFYFDPASVSEAVEGFNLSGRNKMWSIVLERARQRPIAGWGPGTVRPIIAETLQWKHKQVPPREYPPHNEYLQVLHDGGAIGLALLLSTAITLLAAYLRLWRRCHRRSDPVAARWAYTAFVSLGAVALTATIDNTLHYFVVMCPALVVAGCARRLADDGSR